MNSKNKPASGIEQKLHDLELKIRDRADGDRNMLTKIELTLNERVAQIEVRIKEFDVFKADIKADIRNIYHILIGQSFAMIGLLVAIFAR